MKKHLLILASLLIAGPARVKNSFLACYRELKSKLDALKAQDQEKK